MKLDNFVASSDIYDVYESDGMAVRIYKKPEYKEKCLYAALTHARVETTLGNSFIKKRKFSYTGDAFLHETIFLAPSIPVITIQLFIHDRKLLLQHRSICIFFLYEFQQIFFI